MHTVWTSIGRSFSGKILFVDSSSTETSEVHFIDLEKGDNKLTCISPRDFGKFVELLFDDFWLSWNV